MAYSADSFVADEQPTTAKWNKLWTNDASFNDGTGIADDAIIARHLADNSVFARNIDSTGLIQSATGLTASPISVAGPADVASSSVTFTPDVASYALIWYGGKVQINASAARAVAVYLNIGGSNVHSIEASLPSAGTTANISIAGVYKATLAASSQTIKLQVSTNSAGNTAYYEGLWHALVFAQ